MNQQAGRDVSRTILAEDEVVGEIGPFDQRPEEVIDELEARQRVVDEIVGRSQPLEIIAREKDIHRGGEGGDDRRRHQGARNHRR